MSATPSRNPTLDCLRGISILLVVLVHLQMGKFLPAGTLPPSLSRLGVCLFFALSGYLITLLLLTPGVSIRRFYLRRSLRIFPAFYAYLSVVGLLGLLGYYKIPLMSFVAAGTYWINWYPGPRGWVLAHTWSLSVEEQFYLLWPLILRGVTKRWAAPAIVAGLALWPVQRWLRTDSWGHATPDAALSSATYDVILWGCLGALLEKSDWKRAKKTLSSPLVLALSCGALWLLVAWTEVVPSALVPPLRNAALAQIVFWCALNRTGRSPLSWLGTRSYSIYLWHMVFCDPRLSVAFSWPIALTLTVFSGELSYRLLETPVLHWRDANVISESPLCQGAAPS